MEASKLPCSFAPFLFSRNSHLPLTPSGFRCYSRDSIVQTLAQISLPSRNSRKKSARIRNASASVQPLINEDHVEEASSTSGNSIRRRFLEFYAAKGHKILPSSSLVPDDPTVLLTIAGMLLFKPVFLGKTYLDRQKDIIETKRSHIQQSTESMYNDDDNGDLETQIDQIMSRWIDHKKLIRRGEYTKVTSSLLE